MMEERRFIGSAPQALRQKTAVSLAKPFGPWCLVLVEWFAGLTGVRNIVQLEISECRDPGYIGPGRVRRKPRQRQVTAVQVDFDAFYRSQPEVRGGIIRIRLSEHRAAMIER